MGDDEKIVRRCLESSSYRNLQQKAKSMHLPSNYKKIYLIRLICAQKFGRSHEINEIIHMVKMERQMQAQSKKSLRKRIVQASEISSTSKTCSPPMSITPKRPNQYVISCRPELHKSLIKKSLLVGPIRTYLSPDRSNCERILRNRSINLASINQPLQKILNRNPGLSIVKVQGKGQLSPKKAVVRAENILRFGVESVKKKYKPIILSPPRLLNIDPKMLMKGRQQQNVLSLQVSRALKVNPTPAKRQRILSGIYPIATSENSLEPKYQYTQSIGFRRSDGKVSKINAVIQKAKIPQDENRNVEVTIQDIINCNINERSLLDENISDLLSTDDNPQENIDSTTKSLPTLWSEMIKTYSNNNNIHIEDQYNGFKTSDEKLPKISDVFGKFSSFRNELAQPLYVQVSEESERARVINTSMLESLFNIRREFLTSQPLLITTANTTSVYSTTLCVTAAIQHSNAHHTSLSSYVAPEYEYYGRLADIPSSYELMKITAQEDTVRRQYEELNKSLDSSQDLGANVTIPDMVEDALEIISQDGDYMERIGMDVRMQCIICSWAGPKIILENHIRNTHPNDILAVENESWIISIPLLSLIRSNLWESKVLERNSSLYVLSVKYQHPDRLMASLSLLSPDTSSLSGSITTYNRISGEPFMWSGKLEEVPTNLPYTINVDCLNIGMSELELLPNSANLMILNGQLVLKSPGKVVVGNIDLDHVTFILFVKVF